MLAQDTRAASPAPTRRSPLAAQPASPRRTVGLAPIASDICPARGRVTRVATDWTLTASPAAMVPYPSLRWT